MAIVVLITGFIPPIRVSDWSRRHFFITVYQSLQYIISQAKYMHDLSRDAHLPKLMHANQKVQNQTILLHCLGQCS